MMCGASAIWFHRLGRLFLCALLAGALHFSPSVVVAVVAADETSYGFFEKELVKGKSEADQAACDRGLYSASLDHFIKAYLAGDKAGCKKHWAGVLKATGRVNSLHNLLRGLKSRIEFVDEEQLKIYEKRGDIIALLTEVYDDTLPVTGPHSALLASIAKYKANKYADVGDMKDALIWFKKACDLFESDWGKDNPTVISTLYEFAEMQINAHDIAGATATARTGLERAQKIHQPALQRDFGNLLRRLSRMQGGRTK